MIENLFVSADMLTDVPSTNARGTLRWKATTRNINQHADHTNSVHLHHYTDKQPWASQKLYYEFWERAYLTCNANPKDLMSSFN